MISFKLTVIRSDHPKMGTEKAASYLLHPGVIYARFYGTLKKLVGLGHFFIVPCTFFLTCVLLSTTYFSTKLKKECAAYGIVLILWDYVPCVCL